MADNRATLELRGATWARAEEADEAFAPLESPSGLPLVWLSLLDEADLQRLGWWEGSSARLPLSWADQVRAAFADPRHESVPPLEVPWAIARARLQAAVLRTWLHGDPWAEPLRRWAERLDALAAQGPTQRVVLWPGHPEQVTAGEYLEAVVQGIRGWRDPDGAPRPPAAPEAELTGGLDAPPIWHAERHSEEDARGAAPSPAVQDRVVDVRRVFTLSVAAPMAFWLTGSVWVAAAVLLLVTAGTALSVFQRARRDEILSLRLRPGAGPLTVRPPLLTVLVAAALLLSGLVELWGQLHRVQGPCCSRAYYNYWPSREWDTIWVVLVAIALGFVSQTIRVADGRVRVTWFFGLLRLSRPLAEVEVRPVTAELPRSREQRKGLRLRIGWIGAVVADEQAGYAELLQACGEQPELKGPAHVHPS